MTQNAYLAKAMGVKREAKCFKMTMKGVQNKLYIKQMRNVIEQQGENC